MYFLSLTAELKLKVITVFVLKTELVRQIPSKTVLIEF